MIITKDYYSIKFLCHFIRQNKVCMIIKLHEDDEIMISINVCDKNINQVTFCYENVLFDDALLRA